MLYKLLLILFNGRSGKMDSNITLAAQKQGYDPWNIPDTFTLYQFCPEDIRSFLHPFWHSHRTPHPVWFYGLGLYFTILGKSKHILFLKIRHEWEHVYCH